MKIKKVNFVYYTLLKVTNMKVNSETLTRITREIFTNEPIRIAIINHLKVNDKLSKVLYYYIFTTEEEIFPLFLEKDEHDKLISEFTSINNTYKDLKNIFIKYIEDIFKCISYDSKFAEDNSFEEIRTIFDDIKKHSNLCNFKFVHNKNKSYYKCNVCNNFNEKLMKYRYKILGCDMKDENIKDEKNNNEKIIIEKNIIEKKTVEDNYEIIDKIKLGNDEFEVNFVIPKNSEKIASKIFTKYFSMKEDSVKTSINTYTDKYYIFDDKDIQKEFSMNFTGNLGIFMKHFMIPIFDAYNNLIKGKNFTDFIEEINYDIEKIPKVTILDNENISVSRIIKTFIKLQKFINLDLITCNLNYINIEYLYGGRIFHIEVSIPMSDKMIDFFLRIYNRDEYNRYVFTNTYIQIEKLDNRILYVAFANQFKLPITSNYCNDSDY